MISKRPPDNPPFILLSGQWPSHHYTETEIMNVCRYEGLAPCFSCEEDFITAPFDNLIPALDAFLKCLGLHELKSEAHCGWEEVANSMVEGILTHMIATDMVYTSDRTNVEEARSKAKAFLTIFDPSARFFTCAEVYDLGLEEDGLPFERRQGMMTSGIGLTTWTFGTGVIAVDTEKVGVYWIQDED